MKQSSKLLAFLFGAVGLCGASASAQVADTTNTKAAVMAADRALAAKAAKEGASAFLDALEDGAAVLFPGQSILRGARESREAFTKRYGSPSTLFWHPAGAVASADGRLGCTTGFLRFLDAADTSHAERGGTYLTCWRRGDGGGWRIAGHQRSEAPPAEPRVATDALLSRTPHSATERGNGSGLKGAQDADAAFARMGSEPAGPGPAFERYAAVDAMFPGGLAPTQGKAAIRGAFDGFSAARLLEWNPARDLGAASGGLAFTVGLAVNRPRQGPGPTMFNKYFTVWRLERDGQWAWIFDLGSPRPAPR